MSEETTTISLAEKLARVQAGMKVSKEHFNDFGKYSYRNAEDIEAAAKPLCIEHRCTVIVSDALVTCKAPHEVPDAPDAPERAYIKSTAVLIDWDSDSSFTVCAYAREPLAKKGMDDSQITGATSSYARKYALSGMFAVDNTADADSMDNTAKPDSSQSEKRPERSAKEDEFRQTFANHVKAYKEYGVTGAELKSNIESTFAKAIKDFNDDDYTAATSHLTRRTHEQFLQLYKPQEAAPEYVVSDTDIEF